jgi:EpsI family protein
MTGSMQFLRGYWVLLLNLMLAAQAIGFYSVSRQEDTVEPISALSETPHRLGEWHTRQNIELDPESQKILHPDDYVMRTYERRPDRLNANVFIAYFRSQRTGHAPHSPQNCLPGNGWAPERKEVISVPVGDHSISVNRIVVAKGEQRTVVVYWYQTPTGVVANEYRARIQLVLDSIRHNRSDTALVRVELPFMLDGTLESENAAMELLRDVHNAVQQYIPNLNNV